MISRRRIQQGPPPTPHRKGAGSKAYASLPLVRRDGVGGRVGVLIVNLGTPEGTSYWPMRRYLKEFLSDRRVIEVNRILWWGLLNGIILTTRPKRSGHAYDKIWNRERSESPLKTITRSQAERLAERFRSDPEVKLDWAMRYGLPPIAERIERLKTEGCDRILIFPLYPQYCAATTATVMDKAFDALKSMRWQPTLRSVAPYYDHPAYIEALAASIEEYMRTLSWAPEIILASFHGLPQAYADKGDPYERQCMATARLLVERLALPPEKFKVAFQSRFGREEWLKPYAIDTVQALAKGGTKNLLMVTPGFAADCVETLEEVGIGLAHTFRENGGSNFALVPCLNDSDRSIDMLEILIRQELQGWLARVNEI